MKRLTTAARKLRAVPLVLWFTLIFVCALAVAGYRWRFYLLERSFFGAVASGRVEEVSEMLQRHPYLLTVEDGWGEQALNEALSRQNSRLVIALIQAGADVSHESPIRGLPLCQAVSWPASVGGPAVVQSLLEHGASVNAECSGGGHWALPEAASAGNPDTVRILLAHGACVDKPDGFGWTALANCAFDGDEESLEIARLLIAHGANVNARTPSPYNESVLDQVNKSIGLCLEELRQREPDSPTYARNLVSLKNRERMHAFLVEHGAKTNDQLTRRQ